MKAIIMAGGYGTRLQPISLRTPKCLLPVGDSTTILKTLNQIKEVGIEQVIISLNKNQGKVKDFIESKGLDLNIKFLFEQTEEDSDKLGAIGALQYVINNFGADDYLIIAADNYIEGLNFKKMIREHKTAKADATIALFNLTDVSKLSLFGISVLNKDNRITSFQEKPKAEEALSTLASTFVYIVTKEFLSKELPEYVDKEKRAGRKPDNLGDLWAYYLNKKKINGYVFNGYWGDVGSPLYYVDVNHKALDRIEKSIHSSVKLNPSVKISGKVVIKKGVKIDKNVVIIGPCVIGENTKIGQGTIISPYSTILNNVSIGKNNRITGSILFENVKTHDNVKITRAIIDGNSEIRENNRIEEQAMIGFSCKVEPNSQILYNTKLWPFLNVEKNSVINSKIFYQLKDTIYEPDIKESRYWK